MRPENRGSNLAWILGLCSRLDFGMNASWVAVQSVQTVPKLDPVKLEKTKENAPNSVDMSGNLSHV